MGYGAMATFMQTCSAGGSTGTPAGPDKTDPCFSLGACDKCTGNVQTTAGVRSCGWCRDEVLGAVSGGLHAGWCSSSCVTTAGECSRDPSTDI